MTGFPCGAAYLSRCGEPPRLQGQVGFSDTSSLSDFFGDPGLLSEALGSAHGGIARIPSEPLDRGLELSVVLR